VGQAQTTPSASPLVLPSAFATAHTVFLGFGGAPSLLTAAPDFAPLLYAGTQKGLTQAGLQLTSAPSKADLLLTVSIESQLSDVTNGNSFATVFVRLAVVDGRSHALLWNIDEPLRGAFRKASFQKNIDDTVTKVVGDYKTLAAGKVPGA
jgi:hypothetical protein